MTIAVAQSSPQQRQLAMARERHQSRPSVTGFVWALLDLSILPVEECLAASQTAELVKGPRLLREGPSIWTGVLDVFHLWSCLLLVSLEIAEV